VIACGVLTVMIALASLATRRRMPAPDAALPGAPAPDVQAPDVQAPDVQAPEALVPEALVPDVPALEVAAPEALAAEVPALYVPVPDMPAAELPAAEVPAPDMPVPEVAARQMAAPDAARRGRLLAAALGMALLTGVLAPAVAAAGLARHHESAFDTPFEGARAAADLDALPAWDAAYGAKFHAYLVRAAGRAPYLAAVQTADYASAYARLGGEVLPIGGFTGSIPSPTLAQLRADVRAGKFHIVIGLAQTHDPRLLWIAAHCYNFPVTSKVLRNYYCYPVDAQG
jgi:hypothetical protein